MSRSSTFACVLAFLSIPLLLAACTEPNPNYCPGEKNNRCSPDASSPDITTVDSGTDLGVDAPDAEDGATADAGGCDGNPYCESEDPLHPVCENRVCTGCASAAQCGGTTPVCSSAHRCEPCTSNVACRAVDNTHPACDPGTGACVECMNSDDCSGTKPICDTVEKVCKSCSNDDSLCVAKGGGPGVCMADGHCASEAETVYVQYKATGCPQDASPAVNSYCDFATAIQRLSSSGDTTLLVIRGRVDGPLVLKDLTHRITVVGQANGTGVNATVTAGTRGGISVSGAEVQVRDLLVYGGASGILVSGTGTKVRLERVTVSNSLGVGVVAETKAELWLVRSIVRDNKEGGLWNNGAKTVVSNSVLTKNLYGVMYDVSALSSVFEFSTVVDNVGNAATCNQNNPQPISASIISGANVLCTNNNSVSIVPPLPFDASGYHLTKHLGCPTAPKTAPPIDIDGQRREDPIDCGADQFVP